jgi:hypothetical protein
MTFAARKWRPPALAGDRRFQPGHPVSVRTENEPTRGTISSSPCSAACLNPARPPSGLMLATPPSATKSKKNQLPYRRNTHQPNTPAHQSHSVAIDQLAFRYYSRPIIIQQTQLAAQITRRYRPSLSAGTKPGRCTGSAVVDRSAPCRAGRPTALWADPVPGSLAS